MDQEKGKGGYAGDSGSSASTVATPPPSLASVEKALGDDFMPSPVGIQTVCWQFKLKVLFSFVSKK